jgi:hypothetical protein
LLMSWNVVMTARMGRARPTQVLVAPVLGVAAAE